MANKRTDGRAVDVVATSDLEKGTPVYLDGFHGFTMDRVAEDESVALDIAEQVWEMEVPSGLTATKGLVLGISTDGNHTIVAQGTSGSVDFVRVVEAKDANNIVWAKHLPQSGAVAA